MRNFISHVLPFIIAGILLAIFIALAILLSYVVLWGVVIGIVLYIIAAIKNKFFSGEQSEPMNESCEIKPTTRKEQSKHRIIEHNDKD